MPFDFGSFAGGVAGGYNQGRELKLRADEAKLKAKMLEHQINAMEFDQQQKAEQARILGQAAQPFLEAAPGYEDEAQQMSVAPIAETNPSRLVTGAAIRSGKFGDIGKIQEAFETPQQKAEKLRAQYEALQPIISGMGGQTGVSQTPGQAPTVTMVPSINARGQPSFHGTTPREAVGAESKQFSDYQRARRAEGWTDDEIRSGWREEVAKSSGARAGGAETGRMGVRSTPEFQQTEQGVAAARQAGRFQEQPLSEGDKDAFTMLERMQNWIDIIDKIPAQRRAGYLGPFQYGLGKFQQKYGATRGLSRIGKANEEQVNLTKGIEGLFNAFGALESGKVLTANELSRLKDVLPQGDVDPGTFETTYTAFKSTLASIRRARIAGATMPRGEAVGAMRGGQGRLVPLPPR